MSMTESEEYSPEVDHSELHEQAREIFDQEGLYLCGPIMHSDDDGAGWREEFKEDYGLEFTIHCPLDTHDPREVEILHDPADYDQESEKEQILPSEYIVEDKMMIDQSEYVFVGLEDEISRGSIMECMYAYMTNTPFFVWAIDGQEEGGWMFHHAEIVSPDRDTVVEFIRRYENGE